MAFEEKLRALSTKALEQKSVIATEEAVKMAIVSPLFHALEYDPFNPKEIVPEYVADVGIKKGEKVDYAIFIDGNVGIVIECKAPTASLELKHASQLYRYFSVTKARFAILTNGYEWQVYTDLDAPNRMDSRPFLSFDITDLTQSAISELSKFRKSVFDVNEILRTAENLKYVSALKKEFQSELSHPSDELSSMLIKRVYDGRLTASVQQQFTELVKRSISEVIKDRVNARLSSALQHNSQVPVDDEDEESPEIETTEVEWDGYRIATAIASAVIAPDRITIRDQKSYCGILIDNNNRKPLVRLWFNSENTRYISLFDGDSEEKVPVSNPVDMYQFSDRIRATAEKYI